MSIIHSFNSIFILDLFDFIKMQIKFIFLLLLIIIAVVLAKKNSRKLYDVNYNSETNKKNSIKFSKNEKHRKFRKF